MKYPWKAALQCLLFVIPCESIASSHQHDNQNNNCKTTSQTTSKANTMKRATAGAASRVWGEIEKVQHHRAPFDIFRLYMDDDGTFPNNAQYPLLLYKSAYKNNNIQSEQEASAAIVKDDKWTSPWAWGIFTFHHYHSTAWELLLCIQGQADVKLGGESGPIVSIEKGDLALVPPGFVHKQLDSRGGFTLLGSYPTGNGSLSGSSVDTLRGVPTKQQRSNILECSFPTQDPIFEIDLETLF